MKHFTIDTSPDEKKYFVKIDDVCFSNYFKNVPITGTWNLLYSRIFNLNYVDFLRMVRDVYGAKLQGRDKGYIIFYFEEKQSCNRFIKDLDKRFELWKKN